MLTLKDISIRGEYVHLHRTEDHLLLVNVNPDYQTETEQEVKVLVVGLDYHIVTIQTFILKGNDRLTDPQNQILSIGKVVGKTGRCISLYVDNLDGTYWVHDLYYEGNLKQVRRPGSVPKVSVARRSTDVQFNPYAGEGKRFECTKRLQIDDEIVYIGLLYHDDETFDQVVGVYDLKEGTYVDWSVYSNQHDIHLTNLTIYEGTIYVVGFAERDGEKRAYLSALLNHF